MSITITEKQFMDAVSAAQDEWDSVESNIQEDPMAKMMNALHNLAFGALIQKELFKDETEEA